jgi:hypothetical protein
VINLTIVRKFLLNFPLGVLCGTVLTLTMLWASELTRAEDINRMIPGLFGALVGLIAATLALAGVLSNIENQNLIAAEIRRKDLAAWRATLPLVLSKLVSISRNGMLAALRKGDAARWSQSTLEDKLELTSNQMEVLRNSIKYSGEESAAWLAVLIARYQVYLSRSHDLMSSDSKFEKLDTALDWATLYALAEHCFSFARGETDKIEDRLDSSRIRSAFWTNDIEVEDDHRFQTLVDRRLTRYGMAKVSVFQFNQKQQD